MNLARDRVLSVVLAAGVIVGAANLGAYAANGKPLLLGNGNVETRTTTVTNKGGGPALTLKSRASTPSLAVTSDKLVARLNADRVDGQDAAALQTRTWEIALPPSTPVPSMFAVSLDAPVGTYDVSYSLAFRTAQAPTCAIYADGYGDSPPEAAGAGSQNKYGLATASGSAVVRITAASELICSAPGVELETASVDSTIQLTRVDALVRSEATPEAFVE